MERTMTKRRTLVLLALALIIAMIQGCGGGSDHTLSEEEWTQVMSMPAENTKAASELVQRDAESRQQWLSLHEDLQQERSEIGQQRDLLEEDRRLWAGRERSDPIIAEAIAASGLLAACALPLVVIALLLWPRKPESSREEVCEILVDDLVSEKRLLENKPLLTGRIEDQS